MPIWQNVSSNIMYKLKTINRADLVIYHYPHETVSTTDYRNKLYECLSVPYTDFPFKDLFFDYSETYIDVFYNPTQISIEELTFKIMKYGLTK